jgi:hypothetical protein
MFKDTGLDVIKLSEKDYLRTLENGVRFGRIILLENILKSWILPWSPYFCSRHSSKVDRKS